jgi:outer membrane protein assembly factor BamB
MNKENGVAFERPRLTHRHILTFLLAAVAMGCTLPCRILSLKETPTSQPQVSAEATQTPRIEVIATPTSEEMRQGILWTLSAPVSGSMGLGGYCIGEDTVFIMEGQGLVTASDLATGQQLWRWEELWETKGKIIDCDSDGVYLGRYDSRFYALDAHNGRQRWKITLVNMIGQGERWDLATQDEDRLYFDFAQPYGGAYDHLLVAIDKRDGSLLWSHPAGKLLQPYGIVLGKTEQTLLDMQGIVEWVFQGVDPVTGKVKWELSDPIKGGRFVEVSENAFFGVLPQSGSGMSIVAFEIDTGHKLWQTEAEDLGSILKVSPTAIYAVPIFGAFIWVFDRQAGQELWSWQIERTGFLGEFEGTTILSDGSLGFTWAINAQTGDIRWQNDDLVLEQIVGVSQNTLIGLRRLPVVKGPNTALYGIDFATGELKWRIELSLCSWNDLSTGETINGPVIWDDKIVDASEEYSLVFLDPETGDRISAISLPIRPYDFLFREDVLLMWASGKLVAVQP